MMLFLLNNVPRSHGLSPAELLLGRIPGSIYLELQKEVTIEKAIDQCQIQEELSRAQIEHGGNLPILSEGDLVYVYDPFRKSGISEGRSWRGDATIGVIKSWMRLDKSNLGTASI